MVHIPTRSADGAAGHGGTGMVARIELYEAEITYVYTESDKDGRAVRLLVEQGGVQVEIAVDAEEVAEELLKAARWRLTGGRPLTTEK